MYQFSVSSDKCSSPFPPQAHLSTTISASTWHSRLGHPSSLKFQQLAQHLSLAVSNKCASLDCTHCAVAKSHRLPFVLSNSTVNKPLSLIHSDVWGPFQSSNSGFTYYVLFIDDFSRFTWIYPLKYKHEVFAKFVAFKAYVENQFTTSLQVLRTDGGGEYGSNEFSAFFTKHGIVHQLSCPHTPSQNGVAERKHRHLIETTIALLHQSSLPLSYWFDALATAVFLVNCLPSTTLHHKTPFEVLFHSLPDYSLFRVFGCQYFPWLSPYTAHKLQPGQVYSMCFHRISFIL